MIRPVYVIGPFDAVAAGTLLVITFVSGYAFGYIGGVCGTDFSDKLLPRSGVGGKGKRGSSPMFKALPYFLFILPALLLAQTSAPNVPTTLPPQSTSIKDVPVPVPSEVFATLDKFAHANWRAVQRPELGGWKPHGDQAEIALRLGAVIAEGFVAVEAEDTSEVKNLGQAVLGLARALGVERAALRRSRSIIEHAEQGDWLAVRKEWDAVQPDVERGMKELKSDQLAQLVSLGGWLRGTQALTALVLQDYSPENAALLRQPALLDHFEKELTTMQGDRKLADMRDGIEKVRTLLGSGDGPIQRETVGNIAHIAEELLKDLGSKAGKG